MPENQSDDVRDQLREAIYRMLIDKIDHDRYPSATMMNMVEQGLDENLLRAYAQVLYEKIAGDRFPSPDMMKRLISLV